jgi:hypothetical protein
MSGELQLRAEPAAVTLQLAAEPVSDLVLPVVLGDFSGSDFDAGDFAVNTSN